MPAWTTACQDWEERLLAGRSIIPPPIFPDEAEAALEIFRGLKIVDALYSPTFGEASEQWVFDLVAAIFGAYDAESGRRLIREVFVCLPKKNSKSTLAAGIMLTALIRNWRESAGLIILAPTVEVAKNSFDPAKDMVSHDPELKEDRETGGGLIQVQTHIKTLTHKLNNATLKVVAADSDTVGGAKAAWVLIDELWMFGKKPNAENMLLEATGGLLSRIEGVVIYLTTQSDDTPAGVYKQKLDYARGVRDGTIHDPQFLPVIYEFPATMIEAQEHLKPENFHIVNPNMGRSVDEETLVRLMGKAQNDGETAMRGFLSKHLNIEIGLALGSKRWPGADFWLAQGIKEGLSLKQLLERSEVVTIGIDGGGLDDLLGLSVLGREEGGKWLHWGHAWAHKSVFERHKQIDSSLRDFAQDKDLSVVEMGDDMIELADYVEQVEDSGLLDKIGVDPAGIGSVVDAITDRGIDHDRIVGIPQGWKLMGAIKTTERKLAAGELFHGRSRLMAWSVGNAKAEPRGNAIMITKQASGSGKIDPLMALFDSAALMAMNPKPRVKKFQLFFA